MSLAYLFLTVCSFNTAVIFAQSLNASWQFPVADGLIINTIDTIVLQWTSDFAEAWIHMWCQNGEVGNNVVLGSTTEVNPIGTYAYIISKDSPSVRVFPVACHAQLVAQPNGNGVDSPVGVTFVSISDAPAKTFSFKAAQLSTIGVTATTVISAPQASAQVPTDPLSSPTLTNPLSSSFTSGLTSGNISSPTSISSEMRAVTSGLVSPSPTNAGSLLKAQEKGGLAVKIKVTIAVVSVAVGLFITGFVVWCVRRRQSRLGVPELDGNAHLGPYGAPKYGRHELEDEERRKHELEASPSRVELESEPVRHELPVNSPKMIPTKSDLPKRI